MTPEPPPLPPGEMSLVSDELLLADGHQANAVAGYAFDRGGEQLTVHLTFVGRLNHSSDRKQIAIALHPEDAIQLAMDLVAAADICGRRAQQTGGRP